MLKTWICIYIIKRPNVITLVGDDGPEEVWFVVQRLVAHHQIAGVHHPGLQFCRHFPQLRDSLLVMRGLPESLWDVPETDVHHLRRLLDEEEPVAQFLHPPDLVAGQLHDPVHLQLKPSRSLPSPGQPELEDVVVAAALDHLQSEWSTPGPKLRCCYASSLIP